MGDEAWKALPPLLSYMEKINVIFEVESYLSREKLGHFWSNIQSFSKLGHSTLCRSKLGPSRFSRTMLGRSKFTRWICISSMHDSQNLRYEIPMTVLELESRVGYIQI
jgi:hypothetical protein